MIRRFSILASLCLALVSVPDAFAQISRTVMVNSNSGIILYPTNFWSVNATPARAGLGLGTAALSNASAFQPASTLLSNFSTSPVVQIGSGGTGATNAGLARTNLGLGSSNLVYFYRLFLSDIAANTIQSRGLGAAGQPGLSIIAQNLTTNVEFYNTNAKFYVPIEWGSSSIASVSRTNLGIPFTTAVTNTNAAGWRGALGLGATWLTNTNVTNFRTAIGLGTNSYAMFGGLGIGTDIFVTTAEEEEGISFSIKRGTNNEIGLFNLGYFSNTLAMFVPISFEVSGVAATTRTNLGLGATWLTNTNATNFRAAIEFSTNLNSLWSATNTNAALQALGINTSSGSGISLSDFILPSTTVRQILYVQNTNSEPFLGLANLMASNNTTLSNESLFRVGLAEQNNRSAQFGFRVARTNNGGEGFAVFSVYGYNALMMIGPSDRSRTNTATNAGIEADIWTINPTNRVMTLMTTNTGAMEMHRPIGFNTNNISTSAPSNTTVTNPTGWIQFYVGTNSVRVPYYQ